MTFKPSLVFSFMSVFVQMACFLGVSVANASPVLQPLQSLYYASGRSLFSADLDGSNSVPFSDFGQFATGLTVDRARGGVYWISSFGVYRADSSGQNVQRILSVSNGDPVINVIRAITVDPIHEKLYFVDIRNNILFRSDTDGSNLQEIIPAFGIPSNLRGMRDVKVDPLGGKLYWSYNNELRRTNLDGTEQETVFIASSAIRKFDLDLASGEVYWTAPSNARGFGKIQKGSFFANDEQTVIGNLWGPNSVALDLSAGRLFFSDVWWSGPSVYDQTIQSANLDGSNRDILFNFGPSSGRPLALALGPLVVPEPSSLGLLLGSAAMFLLRRKRGHCLPDSPRCKSA